MRYLSPEWMDAARNALAGDPRLATSTAGVRLVLDQVVTDGPDGEVQWHLVIDDGTVDFVDGPAPRHDLRITTSYTTAAQIAAGTLSAQRAFIDGQLQMGGDFSTLIEHQRALGTIDDALAEVRRETDFPTAPA